MPLTTNNFEIRIYGNGSNTPAENSNLLTLATAEIGEIEEDLHYCLRDFEALTR